MAEPPPSFDSPQAEVEYWRRLAKQAQDDFEDLAATNSEMEQMLITATEEKDHATKQVSRVAADLSTEREVSAQLRQEIARLSTLAATAVQQPNPADTAKLKALESQVESLNEKLRMAEAETQDLHVRLDSALEETVFLQQEMDDLRQNHQLEIRALEERIRDDQAGAATESLKDLQTQNQQLLDQLQSAITASEESRHQAAQLEEQLAEEQEKNDAVALEMQELTDELMAKNTKLKELAAVAEGATDQAAVVANLRQQLEQSGKQLEQLSVDLRNAQAALEEERTAAEAAQTELSEMTDEVMSKSSTIKDLQASTQSLTESARALQDKLTAAEQRASAATAELETQRQQLQQARQESDAAAAASASLAARLSTAEQQVESLNGELQQARLEVESAGQARVAQLQGELDAARAQQRAAATDSDALLTTVRGELETARQALADKDEQLRLLATRLEASSANVEQSVNALKDQLAAALQDARDKQARVAHLESQLAEHASATNDAAQLEQQIAQLQEELSDAQQQYHELEQVLQTKEETISDLHGAIAGLETELRTVQQASQDTAEAATTDALQARVDELTARNEELEQDLATERESAEATASQLAQDLSELTDGLMSKDQQLQVAEATVDKLTQELNALRAAGVQASDPASMSSASLKQQVLERASQLQQSQADLDALRHRHRELQQKCQTLEQAAQRAGEQAQYLEAQLHDAQNNNKLLKTEHAKALQAEVERRKAIQKALNEARGTANPIQSPLPAPTAARATPATPAPGVSLAPAPAAVPEGSVTVPIDAELEQLRASHQRMTKAVYVLRGCHEAQLKAYQAVCQQRDDAMLRAATAEERLQAVEANARALANQLVATQDELAVVKTAHEQSAIELVSPAESKAMEASLTPVTRPRAISTPDVRDTRVNLNNYRLEALDVAAPQYTSSQVLTMLGEADSLVLDDDTRHDIRLLRDQAAALMRLEQDMARLLSTSAETYSSDDKQRHPSQRVVATMQQQLLILRDLVAVGSVSMISAVQQLGTVVTSLMTTFKRRYLAQMRENAALLSQLQKTQGNIVVFVRIRPMLGKEVARCQAAASSDTTEHYQVLDVVSDNDLAFYDHRQRTWRPFAFDRVIPPAASQSDVFREVESIALSVVDGYNACVLAYGQTGSGKTFTMEGMPDQPGVNQRMIRKIFALAAQRASTHDFLITVGMVEIYNEEVRDLLSASTDGTSAGLRKIGVRRSTADSGIQLPDLTQQVVTSPAEVQRVLARGHAARAVAATNVHEHSSRSHCILQIEVQSTPKTATGGATGPQTVSKLYLVDLAGSERVQKSGVAGAQLREAQHINKSLSALGDVLEALDKKASHIPYRNSKLTYLLQDSLGGNSRTLMMATVCPTMDTAEETVFTLQFAARARNIQLGPVKKNVQFKNLEEVNRKLKEDLSGNESTKKALQSELAALKRQLATTEDKLNDMRRSSKRSEEEQQRVLLAQLEIAKQSNAELSTKLKATKAQNQTDQEEIRALQNRIQQVSHQYSAVSRDKDRVEQKLVAVEQELERQRLQLLELRNEAATAKQQAARLVGHAAAAPQVVTVTVPRAPSTRRKEPVTQPLFTQVVHGLESYSESSPTRLSTDAVLLNGSASGGGAGVSSVAGPPLQHIPATPPLPPAAAAAAPASPAALASPAMNGTGSLTVAAGSAIVKPAPVISDDAARRKRVASQLRKPSSSFGAVGASPAAAGAAAAATSSATAAGAPVAASTTTDLRAEGKVDSPRGPDGAKAPTSVIGWVKRITPGTPEKKPAAKPKAAEAASTKQPSRWRF